VADMSVVRPVLHVSLNRLRPDTANFYVKDEKQPSFEGVPNYRA
jgi:hypothetical protein